VDNYTETFETWNKVASLYQEKFMDLNLYNDTYDFICNLLSKNKASVLEIGCGPGNITKYFLSQRPDFNIFGIDVAPNMIVLAKNNNPSARFSVMDCREISKIKTKFDAIICGFCIPYLSFNDCQKFLIDCSCLLNNDGLLYISFVEGNPYDSRFFDSKSGGRVFFNFYNPKNLKEEIIKNNFNILKEYKVEYNKSDSETEFHIIYIAKKLTQNL
jgi:2-polyprenyl-3-methyl-5-hydroxy-6-metoxy-1,4-benzoquinol methylase